jgi:hypothetical protein
LFNKTSRLAAALGATKFVTISFITLVTKLKERWRTRRQKKGQKKLFFTKIL